MPLFGRPWLLRWVASLALPIAAVSAGCQTDGPDDRRATSASDGGAETEDSPSRPPDGGRVDAAEGAAPHVPLCARGTLAPNPADIYYPSRSGGLYYAYAPSAIVERRADGVRVEHLFTCHNAASGQIHDVIHYTRLDDGRLSQSKDVLSSAFNAGWDAGHTCDPAVVAGEFRIGGETYGWAMFYLGIDTDTPSPTLPNQVGVAFAKTLDADRWIKLGPPLVTAATGDPWGVGQPSATSVDGKGAVLLFYSRGSAKLGTHTYRTAFDLSNPTGKAPTTLVTTPEAQITDRGVLDADGRPGALHNSDVVYDPTRDLFFFTHDIDAAKTCPTVVSDATEILVLPGSDVWGGTGVLKRTGMVIDPARSGHVKNHNAGIGRTPFGTLPDPSAIGIYVAASDTCSAGAEGLFTYGIRRVDGLLTTVPCAN